MAEIEILLAQAAERVTRALDALIPQPTGPESRLVEAMRYAALGPGKRIRAFLVLECGGLFDADDRALLRTAAALECVHAYSLVHDDLPCMDDDDLRRGRPATHRQFDEATALLAGDALQSLAFEILAEAQTHPDPQMRCLLIAGLARAIGPAGMAGGQMIDLAGTAAAGDPIVVTRMNRMKTGALIHFAVEAGALIGCASEEQRQALTRYAQDLGHAFQLVDDLLDAEGRTEEIGKTAGKDAAAGKVNFVTLFGADQARERLLLLAAQGKTHLQVLGPRAKALAEIVDFVLDRRR